MKNTDYSRGKKNKKKGELKIVLCTVPQNIHDDREGGELPVIPKIAIMSILNWIRKFGYSGEFYDIDMFLPSEDEIFNYFKLKQPNVVGISAVVSTSYLQIKKIANIIRRACPSTWLVLGGYMAASANVLLRKTDVDICVLGDGENPFVSFLDYVQDCGRKKDFKKLSEIKGLAFLNDENEMEITGYGEPISASEMNFFDYEILAQGLQSKSDRLEKYYLRNDSKKCTWFNHDKRTYEPHRKPNIAHLWTSKGCVGRCTFCQRFSAGYSTLNLERIDRHLVKLKEKYHVQFISIVDETFGSNKKCAYEIAKLLKKHDMLWCATGVRCTSLTADDIKFLREHGCTGLKFGVESGCQKILNIMEKRFTLNNVYTALKNAHENGLYSPQGFCIGMPGETDETVMETGRFLGEIAKLHGVLPGDMRVGFFYALPLPGTPLYQYAQLQGVIGATSEEEEKYLIYISDKSVRKNNFVNLTGMNTKQVIFWDFLLLYEAMRTYYSSKLPENNNMANSLKHNTYRPYSISCKDSKSSPEELLSYLKLKNLPRYLASPITYLNKILVRSRLITKIPRWLFYGVMRNLLYLEYKIQVSFGYIKVFSKKQVPPLTEAESLRVINQKILAILPAPQTLTEKNRNILLLGR